MNAYSGKYEKKTNGQAFELVFPYKNPNEANKSFVQIITMGAAPIHGPKNMP